MNKGLDEIQFHVREIERHESALEALGHIRKKFVLPSRIPFVSNLATWFNCKKCNQDMGHVVIFYKSHLWCPQCFKHKFGSMPWTKNWEIVRKH